MLTRAARGASSSTRRLSVFISLNVASALGDSGSSLLQGVGCLRLGCVLFGGLASCINNPTPPVHIKESW